MHRHTALYLNCFARLVVSLDGVIVDGDVQQPKTKAAEITAHHKKSSEEQPRPILTFEAAKI